MSVEPTVNVSPGSSFARLTRRPFTSIPFVESRSTIQYAAPSWRSSACRRETFASSTWMSASREAAEHDAALVDALLLPVPREDGDLALEAELLGGSGLGRLLHARLVDHRGAGLDLLLRLVRCLLAPLRLHHARRDAKLADREIVVGLEQHLRRRQQRVALALRVLPQVLLELGDERALVTLELLAVGLREVDGVLVRDVHARDGDRLVVVHLLRKLARELDGLHVRPERAPEDALEQRLYFLLDRP